MTQKLDEKRRQELLAHIPVASFGTPRDIAEVAAFFASDEARYITGQVLCVDGGLAGA
jgi:3-oxoacyl-[acyl-carrier protein] reductase